MSDSTQAEQVAGNGGIGEPRIGVFICHCGGNISDVVDVKRVAEEIGRIPGVAISTTHMFACSDPGQAMIEQKIKELNLNRVIVCWMLYQHARKTASPMERRHSYYITAGFLVITFAILKAGVAMGIDAPILLPLGMFLADAFNAIMGVAIIKDRLFDITLVVSKGTLYSMLAALLIFIYSLTEHILVTYFGRLLGGRSELTNILSVAVGIAILMPLKQRLEHGINGYFAQRRLEF